MIAVAGLSPAWQQLLILPQLRLGEVVRATRSEWFASGKPTNVGSSLSYLDAEHAVVMPIGGATGRLLTEEAATRGLAIVPVELAAATRVCTTLVESTGRVTELVPEAPAMRPAEVSAFKAAFLQAAASADVAVLIGSLPPGAPVDLYRDLMTGMACPTIVDARGDALLCSLERRPMVVKPNRSELAATLQATIANDSELFAAAQSLVERGARHALITDGANAVHLVDAANHWIARPPRIQAINPIGSGDYLAGGLAWGLATGRSILDAVRIGIAAAAANAATLRWGQFTADELLQLAEQVEIRRTG